MILCVNANAAIDRTAVIDHFRLDAIHRPRQVLALPGGKGCNVGRALKTLGEDVTICGWVGGYAGQFIEHGLQAEGIQTAFVHTQVESRTCFSILDLAAHSMTEIYEKGGRITRTEQLAFHRMFEEQLARASLVTLSGSLPPGVPRDFYARLIRQAKLAGVPCFLDSSGKALQSGLSEASPALVKPNRMELSALTRAKTTAREPLIAIAQQLYDRYHTRMVVSFGTEGALAVEGGRTWWASLPALPAISAVGSGDSMLAGLAYGYLRGMALDEALCLGVAAGAANTLILGAGRFEKQVFEELLPQVVIEGLSAFTSSG